METATVNGVKIEYESLGSGEPMLFTHGALMAATFAPLVRERALERYRRIRYHRRGYAGGGHPGLEPPMLSEPAGAAFFAGPLAPFVGAYQRGEKQRAAELFRDAVAGPDAARTLEERLGAEAGVQAVADADTVFGTEFPEIAKGLFTAADAPRVHAPALSLVGRESHALLLARLAAVEGMAIPHATHFLQVEQPAAVAAAIAGFAAKHPLS